MLLKKQFFLIILVFIAIIGLGAQENFPNTNFWSLDAGLGMSDLLVDGVSFQVVIDPKLSLTPASMIGVKVGLSYSSEDKSEHNTLSNIFTIEALFYYRHNIFRLGNPNNTINIFLQGGIGLVAAYRGEDNVFDDEKLTRGSAMADIATGVTIPINERWHIEPQVRTGYPHLWGVSVTGGYKFPLRKGTTDIKTEIKTDYVEIIKTLPPNEIIKRVSIYAIEFILFGPDIGRYNVGIDRDAQGLNELVLNHLAETLKENPNLRVRIEGHANPVTHAPGEAEELLTLSALRANNVAAQLRAKGVSDSQMIVVSFGGTRTVTSDHDIWNRNRRVELMLIGINTDE